MNWQDPIVLLSVAWAAWTVFQAARRTWAGQGTGCDCPSASSCGKSGSREPQLVTIEPSGRYSTR